MPLLWATVHVSLCTVIERYICWVALLYNESLQNICSFITDTHTHTQTSPTVLTKTKATFVVLTARKLWQNRPPSSSPLSTAEPAATYTHTPTLSNLFSITDATIISLSLTLLSQREGKTVFVLMLLLRRSECEWILCKGVSCCCCCCFAFFLCSGFVACHRHQQRHTTTAARNILESVCL